MLGPNPLENMDILANGVAVLLIAMALDLLKDAIIDTGDTYIRILGQFATKQKTALVLVGFAVAGSYVSGALQLWLVELLSQPGRLSIGAGVCLLGVVALTNQQVQSWDPLSGEDPLMSGMLVAGAALIILPLL